MGGFPGSGLLVPWRGPASVLVEAALSQALAPVWWLRGAHMRTRQGLLDEWAAAAQFPPHFGGTWDAFRDALAELPAGGTFLLLDADHLLRDAPPTEGQTWLAILRVVQAELAPLPFQVVLQAEPTQYETLLQGLQALEMSAT